ncbi:MAG TPA: hypothetical protein VM118_08885, partial [Acidobacteriota bacterium]|nr:hypothetical protein [Acidobacteriota bacterium]
MSKPKPPRRRLDEILIEEGLVSEADVTEALLRQKAYGGKFGSQVLFHRHIDEAALVRALSIQFGCKGVVLGGREIPDDVLRMIPRKVCLSRRVLPYAYDADTETLKIACEDPGDPDLERELSFVAGGRKVQLYVSAELALNTALARYHLGRNVSLEDSLLLE